MYKKYQIKWLLILWVIIFLCTLFLIQVDITKVSWWHFLDHSLKIFIPIAGCWMVYGYFLTNSFYQISNFLKNILSIVLGVIVIFILGFLIDIVAPKSYLFIDKIGYHTPREILIHFAGNTFLSLICYFVFLNRYTSKALRITKIEKDLVEQEHLRAQLIALQQQISPHFLFNSLSTLKTLVDDPLARDYIVHLASVYRHVLSFNDQYLTKLDDELNFVNSYVYILNKRFGNMLQVDIDIPQQDRTLYLPSLSLQLLIENAIKHNICSEERPLHISIITTVTQQLRVENNFQPKKSRIERSGMGLKNIIERYKLLVDKSVDVTQNNEKFIVTIPLLKNESNYHRR
jgi:sensor histidine kinase YesM